MVVEVVVPLFHSVNDDSSGDGDGDGDDDDDGDDDGCIVIVCGSVG